ncbi:MAG: ATP-binding protein [Nitrospiraceae bacterium]|nr:ATP-binding protein [Nitrospiraceae bacterium]
MRSLFMKIFLWFWLAVTLVGAIGVVIALTTNPRAAAIARYEKQISEAGRTLADAYKAGGARALAEEEARIGRQSRISVLLFGEGGPLSGRFTSPRGRRLAGTALLTGEPQFGPGRRGLWYAQPVEGDFAVLAEIPHPSPLARVLDPRQIGLRLSVTFIVAGVVCYLLARSLTAPILQLQKAARQVAAGALTTRVGPLFGERRDEIADLGRDFDVMTERIEALLSGQRRLLRDISHELRSPLARLNVALELARQRSGADADKALDRIGREADRLNQLIGELVTLTLLESGAEKIEGKGVALLPLVQAVADDANFEASDRGRLVRIVSAEDVTVAGSEEMLRRAIENVVRNAVRYTEEGTTVDVNIGRVRKEGRQTATVRVRDHGRGVPESALAQLFRPFYRVADARDRQTGGTGIGLAITERAVVLHGGTVKASNDPEGGLVVEICLPCAEA